MSQAFDPYLHWLGIRDPVRPPNHYRLLGIELFEADSDVIATAADRQMTHVRTFQSGKYSEFSQRVLNELSAARLCLLKPEAKRAYDEQLRAVLEAKATRIAGRSRSVSVAVAAPPAAAVELSAPSVNPLAEFAPEVSPFSRRRKPRKKQPAYGTFAALAFVIVAAAGLGIVVLKSRPAVVEKTLADKTASRPAASRPPAAKNPRSNTPEKKLPSAVETEITKVDTPESTPAEIAVDPVPVVNEPTTGAPAEVAEPAAENPVAENMEPATVEPPIAEAERPQQAPGAPEIPALVPLGLTTSLPPVPADADLKAAENQIREIFKAEFDKARMPEAMVELAAQLRTQARASGNLPANAYALLDLALGLSSTAGDLAGALSDVKELHDRFAVDEGRLKLEVLTKVARAKRVPARDQMIATAVEASSAAAAAEQFEVAAKLAKIAGNLVKGSKDRDLIKDVATLDKTVGQRRKEFEEAVAAANRLKETPDDASAFWKLGAYLCFVRNDWAGGLPLLARGDDDKIAAAAKLELAGADTAAGQVAVADAWWEADKSAKAFKGAVLQHSGTWYTKALPQLTGLDATRVQKRVDEIGKSSSDRSSNQTLVVVDLPNDAKLKLRRIPAGKFLMGSPPGEPAREAGEIQHLVTLTKAFYLGVTEVTQAQWTGVMGKNPSQFRGSDDLPVECVSWSMAQQFCDALNQSAAGKRFRFRLPTEAEWEYAARAGTETVFFFGNDVVLLPEYGWYAANSGGKTHAAAGLKPNAWGLYDVYGNVGEWCQDFYAEPYSENPAPNPTGPTNGQNRVVRSSAFYSHANWNRSAKRWSVPINNGFSHSGLRVAADSLR